MTTLAWLLLLTGGLIIRQVTKGRVTNIGQDLSDAFLAIAQGDTAGFTAVLARTGDSTDPTFANLGDALGQATVGGASAVTAGANTSAQAIAQGLQKLGETLNSSIALAAILRGSKAKGYRWAATGPDYYDCSGLMWRAAQDVGYKGIRFTTFTVGAAKGFIKVGGPATQGPGTNGSAGATIGDLVVWPTKHMGVITDIDQFYSAKNVKSGIGLAKISTWGDGTPTYYRYVGK